MPEYSDVSMDQLQHLKQALEAMATLEQQGLLAAADENMEQWQALIHRQQIAIQVIAGIMGKDFWPTLHKQAEAIGETGIQDELRRLNQQLECLQQLHQSLLARGVNMLADFKQAWEQTRSALQNLRRVQTPQPAPHQVDVTG